MLNKPVQFRRVYVSLTGVVQGVGFRPFVHRLARAHALTGWVRNSPKGVQLEVQGRPDEVNGFLEQLGKQSPPNARIESTSVCERSPNEDAEFRIIESESTAQSAPSIPPDLAICEDCAREIQTPGEKRFRYPFTNCTNCGPRYSIVTDSPYDRQKTSMARFTLCTDCAREYGDPCNRRFHAEPIACPECGPSLSLLGSDGTPIVSGKDALGRAVQAIRDGLVVTMKGLGGFQLLVDATNAAAVSRLRRRKQREHKPFAVMLPTVERVSHYCVVSDVEKNILLSPAAPIVLLRRRNEGNSDMPIVATVAPNNPQLGVMLPYTPLHRLLLQEVNRPLICTSGNRSEEPMCFDFKDALTALGAVADLFLTHNRPIVRPVDDSVVRVDSEGMQILRRARGYVPEAIELGFSGPTILALGGHLKNTIALRTGTKIIVSQHLGDLESPRARSLLEMTVHDLLTFYQAKPKVVVCDLHPDYATTRFAQELAGSTDIRLLQVQHHHAHIASVVAEHQLTGPVLGFSWDGTGYGPDGSIWGGETLLCHGDSFDRVGTIRPFRLPGGELAVRDPRRSAIGLLFEMDPSLADNFAHRHFSRQEARVFLQMLERNVHSPTTTSMGRLFDAVSAIIGLQTRNYFEGQAGMAMEFAAASAESGECYHVLVNGESPAIGDWIPMIHAILRDLASGVPVGVISSRFHGALDELALNIAKRNKTSMVALSGGCFQNLYLAELLRSSLRQAGFEVYTNRRVPPNDGGISLGQIHVAACQLRNASWKLVGDLHESHRTESTRMVTRS